MCLWGRLSPGEVREIIGANQTERKSYPLPYLQDGSVGFKYYSPVQLFGSPTVRKGYLARFIKPLLTRGLLRNEFELRRKEMTEAKMQETPTYAPGTFCWVELATTDSAAAKKFYTELFGWTFTDSPIGPDMVYTMLKLDGKDVGALPPAAFCLLSGQSGRDARGPSMELIRTL